MADQNFDLKSILEDSLKAPVKGSEADAPALSVSPISPAIPEAPSQPPQVNLLLCDHWDNMHMWQQSHQYFYD